MDIYRNINRDSGVVAYEGGADFIRVKFSNGAIYLYTDKSAGSHHINRMKRLAFQGTGFNAYINDHVKQAYARKEQRH